MQFTSGLKSITLFFFAVLALISPTHGECLNGKVSISGWERAYMKETEL